MNLRFPTKLWGNEKENIVIKKIVVNNGKSDNLKENIIEKKSLLSVQMIFHIFEIKIAKINLDPFF